MYAHMWSVLPDLSLDFDHCTRWLSRGPLKQNEACMYMTKGCLMPGSDGFKSSYSVVWSMARSARGCPSARGMGSAPHMCKCIWNVAKQDLHRLPTHRETRTASHVKPPRWRPTKMASNQDGAPPRWRPTTMAAHHGGDRRSTQLTGFLNFDLVWCSWILST